MTAKEFLVPFLVPGYPPDPREIFLRMALHAPDLRTADGCRLVDLTDFTTFLIECAEAVKPAAANVRTSRVDLTCPRCGHVHQGDEECEMDCGAERICRCPNQVRV